LPRHRRDTADAPLCDNTVCVMRCLLACTTTTTTTCCHCCCSSRPYECNVCEKKFTCIAHLQRHSVIHTGVKPHKCLVCGKAFGRQEHLRIHVKVNFGAFSIFLLFLVHLMWWRYACWLHFGSNHLLMHTVSGYIMHCSVISLCQLDSTSEIVKCL